MTDRAAAAGLQRDWEDANGTRHRVDDAVIDAVIARLDPAPADSPFLSADLGAPVMLPPTSAAHAELLMEDGATLRLPVVDGAIAGIGATGYHRLLLDGREMTLAVAPRHCPQPPGRGWGAAVQIPALRDAQPAPFGDVGALAAAARALGRSGACAMAVSPTHALFPGAPGRFSPYSPSTRSFHNVLLADPALVGAPPPPTLAGALIDWPGATQERLLQLRKAYDAAPPATRAALASYRHQRGAALEAHARFDALHAMLGGAGWRDWPADYHDQAGDAVNRFAAAQPDEIAFYAFLQWLADLGLATAQRAAAETMSVGLIADLAIGVAGDGSHGWSRPDDLLTGLTIGAPPDPFGPEGQNWGITTLDPFALARTGFQPFIDTIRTALAHAGGIRIDHALGLDRLWVIPEGAAASDGVYLTMPAAHLKRIIAIEGQRAGAIVIAEDLGTVPPGLRDDLAARGMLGMRVLPFEREADGGFVPPEKWDAAAVAMTGTHDTPTLAGWWTERDLDWGQELGRTVDRRARAKDRAALFHAIGGAGDPPAEPPLDTILASVADAPGALMIVPIEDLIGITEQPNIPGTIDEHPNWRRRLPQPTAALLDRPEVARRTSLLTAKRPG